MKYKVHVVLDVEYDDIEADSKQEAFEVASDAAISGGDWYWSAEELEEEEES